MATVTETRATLDDLYRTEDRTELKREDYFLAGALVVWDIDPRAECFHVHRRGVAQPLTYCKGQMAEAEPAVPGWQIAVDRIFAG